LEIVVVEGGRSGG
jgi:hypothetical protein